MADLSTDFLGIKSPNPFWLASAPPTDKEINVRRAFEAGWGGVVWKTLGEDPPVVNVNGPRYATLWSQDRRVIGFNNIELISDRPLQVNLDEIRRVKRDFPDRAMIVSLMVPVNEASWKAILAKVADTGADGVELNFGCPHGMSERGMGSAVGQVPDYTCQIVQWVNSQFAVYNKSGTPLLPAPEAGAAAGVSRSRLMSPKSKAGAGAAATAGTSMPKSRPSESAGCVGTGSRLGRSTPNSSGASAAAGAGAGAEATGRSAPNSGNSRGGRSPAAVTGGATESFTSSKGVGEEMSRSRSTPSSAAARFSGTAGATLSRMLGAGITE